MSGYRMDTQCTERDRLGVHTRFLDTAIRFQVIFLIFRYLVTQTPLCFGSRIESTMSNLSESNS